MAPAMFAPARAASGLGGASRQGRGVHAAHSQQPEDRLGDGDNHHGQGHQHRDEDQKRLAAKPADGLHGRRRRHAGDDERHDERYHGHPDRVHPDGANRFDGVGGAQERRVAAGGNGDSDGDGGPEGEKNPGAFLHRVVAYIIRSPPLMSNDAPVMYPAASDATKQIRSETSSGVPSLGTGYDAARRFSNSEDAFSRVSSVSIIPRQIAFTVMPNRPSSFAAARVRPSSPAFDAV